MGAGVVDDLGGCGERLKWLRQRRAGRRGIFGHSSRSQGRALGETSQPPVALLRGRAALSWWWVEPADVERLPLVSSFQIASGPGRRGKRSTRDRFATENYNALVEPTCLPATAGPFSSSSAPLIACPKSENPVEIVLRMGYDWWIENWRSIAARATAAARRDASRLVIPPTNRPHGILPCVFLEIAKVPAAAIAYVSESVACLAVGWSTLCEPVTLPQPRLAMYDAMPRRSLAS